MFVGEALVGNEAVDQLSKFNAAMSAFATNTMAPRLIDGVVLTKFDTIDDKVGAAVSLAHTTGWYGVELLFSALTHCCVDSPIVFVGSGQHYNDLKKLNTKAVVRALLK